MRPPLWLVLVAPLTGCIDFERLVEHLDAAVDQSVAINDLAMHDAAHGDGGTDLGAACTPPPLSGAWRQVTFPAGIYALAVDGDLAYLATNALTMHVVQLGDPALSSRKLGQDYEESYNQGIAAIAVAAPGELLVASALATGPGGYAIHELLLGTTLDGQPVEQYIPAAQSVHSDGENVKNLAVYDGEAHVGLYTNTSTGTGVVSTYALPLTETSGPAASFTVTGTNLFSLTATSFGLIGGTGTGLVWGNGINWSSIPGPSAPNIGFDVPRELASAGMGASARTWLLTYPWAVCSITGDQPLNWTQSMYRCEQAQPGGMADLSGSYASAIATSPCAPDLAVVVGSAGQLVSTTDGGQTWTAETLPGSTFNATQVAITSTGRVVVGGDQGTLFVRP